jgi:RNA polymerase sigma-70 factor (ECF subfamily)
MIPAAWREELEDCFKSKSGPVYRFLYQFTRKDRELTKDLVQETFRKAAVQWHELRCLPDEERERWLIRVAAHTAVDRFRRQDTARRMRPLVQARYQPDEVDVHRQAMNSIAIQRFTEVTSAMPPARQQVALLFFRCRWKQHEIAEALGISAARVKQQVDAARRTLQRELRPYLPDSRDVREEDS